MNRFLFAVLLLIALTFSVIAQSATATVAWTPVTTNVNGQPVTGVTYNVLRSTVADGSAAVKLNASAITAATYLDTTALNTTTYYYMVEGVASDGTVGARSAPVRYNYSDKIPAQVTGVTVR